jgi:hypothetical protein
MWRQGPNLKPTPSLPWHDRLFKIQFLACWLAVRYMQNAFLRLDEAGKQGKGKPMDAFVAEFLGKH